MKKIKKILSYIIIIISILLIPFSIKGYIKVNAFNNFILCIDPGHGGKDNGASYLDVYEDEINLSIASKLYEICLKKNLMAYVIRTDDYDLASLYAPNRKREDLKRRAEIINSLNCDIFISIHMNSYASNSVNGPMVYYEKEDENSYELSKKIQEQLNILANKQKKVHFDDFYLFRECNTPGALVECGFITNDEERIKLLDDSNQESIADAIYEGIYQFYLR